MIASPLLPVVAQLSQTALNVASRNGQLEVVQALVAAGAFLNIKDNVGACMGKGLGLLKQLGERGARDRQVTYRSSGLYEMKEKRIILNLFTLCLSSCAEWQNRSHSCHD